MISRSGACAIFHASPGLVVALEIFGSSVGISEITESCDDSCILFENLGGSLGTGEICAICDVARSQQQSRGLIWFRRSGLLQIAHRPPSSRRNRDEDREYAQKTDVLAERRK